MNLLFRDLSEKLSSCNSINISEAMLKLNGIMITGEEILEQSAESLSGSILVNFKVIEVTASSCIPME